jgi:hypothetical protein
MTEPGGMPVPDDPLEGSLRLSRFGGSCDSHVWHACALVTTDANGWLISCAMDAESSATVAICIALDSFRRVLRSASSIPLLSVISKPTEYQRTTRPLTVSTAPSGVRTATSAEMPSTIWRSVSSFCTAPLSAISTPIAACSRVVLVRVSCM